MTTDYVQEVLAVRAGGNVKRWHTVPVIGHQTVADHVGQCLSLLMFLHPDPSVPLIKALTWHDCAELFTGDTPAPVKRQVPMLWEGLHVAERHYHENVVPTVGAAMSALSDEDKAWMKAIDVLELVMWASDQWALGNTHADLWVNRGMSYLEARDDTPEIVLSFVDDVVHGDRPRLY